MRRLSARVPTMIALIVVALLTSGAGLAVSFGADAHPASRGLVHASVERNSSRSTEPDWRGRAPFLHAQAPSIGRIHASHLAGDGARSAAALDAEPSSLDRSTHRASGAAVDARQRGVTSPGQPAPSSRAPPSG
jgi:hypothetical protein